MTCLEEIGINILEVFNFGKEGDSELEIKDEFPGWVVPKELKKRWSLTLGPHTSIFSKVCAEQKI